MLYNYGREPESDNIVNNCLTVSTLDAINHGMSKAYFITLLISVSILGCKKDKNGDDNSPIPLNTWKVGDNSYIASKILLNGSMFIATNDTQTVSVTFNNGSLPQTDGSIMVNRDGLSVAGCVGTNPTTDVYYSTGSDNVTATYSITNNKIAVTVPGVWAKNKKGDSLKISANLAQ